MAARFDAFDAANQPMTQDAMIKWLVDQVGIAQECGYEYCFFVEALGHPQWKEILTNLHKNVLTCEEASDKYVFAGIVANAKNLEQVQWVVEHFGITADSVFGNDECPALRRAVRVLNCPMVEWLVTHFKLDTHADIRDEVARAIINDCVMSSFARRTVVVPDDADDSAQNEMICLLKTLFKL
jgi:hypothetical protein